MKFITDKNKKKYLNTTWERTAGSSGEKHSPFGRLIKKPVEEEIVKTQRPRKPRTQISLDTTNETMPESANINEIDHIEQNIDLTPIFKTILMSNNTSGTMRSRGNIKTEATENLEDGVALDEVGIVDTNENPDLWASDIKNIPYPENSVDYEFVSFPLRL